MPNLDGMAEHVAYEVNMLVETARRLTPPLADTVTNNAHLESFLIHARSLDNFLRPIPKNPQQDDVFAQHFYAKWIGKGSLPDGLRDDVNKRVAHLTDTRVGEQADVSPAGVARSLLGSFCDFSAQLGAGKWPALDEAEAVALGYLAVLLDPLVYPGAFATTTTSGTVVMVKD